MEMCRISIIIIIITIIPVVQESKQLTVYVKRALLSKAFGSVGGRK